MIKNTSKDFNIKICELQLDFIQQINELTMSIETKIKNSSDNSEDFLTLTFQEILDRIKISRHPCSKVLIAPSCAFSSPHTIECILVCTDGSLQVANGVRAAAYSSSFGPQSPHLNFSSPSIDTSSSTIPEILAMSHALQTAIILNIKKLIIFTDSTPAATLVGTAVLSSIHQSHDLSSLSKKIPLLKSIFNTIHNNAKKLEILALCHLNAHQSITDLVSATNSIADALAKEEAKANLLLKLPQSASRPRMTEINFSLPSTGQNLTY